MSEDIESASKAANNSNQSEYYQLLWIIRKLHGETCWKMRDNCLWLIKPDTQHCKAHCANDSSEETSPVVPNKR